VVDLLRFRFRYRYRVFNSVSLYCLIGDRSQQLCVHKITWSHKIFSYWTKLNCYCCL